MLPETIRELFMLPTTGNTIIAPCKKSFVRSLIIMKSRMITILLKAASCKALLVLPFSPFLACDQCSGVVQKFFFLCVAIHNMVYYPGVILHDEIPYLGPLALGFAFGTGSDFALGFGTAMVRPYLDLIGACDGLGRASRSSGVSSIAAGPPPPVSDAA